MIRVYAEGNLENTFHMWLPVTGFISDETYFLRPDPDTTVTEPGNAEGVLTFSGYDARNGSIWYDSGRGYTRNGRIKPDLAAPAVEVAAVDLRGRVTTRLEAVRPQHWEPEPAHFCWSGGSFEEMFLPWTVSQYSGI